jgi:hypothetical protein
MPGNPVGFRGYNDSRRNPLLRYNHEEDCWQWFHYSGDWQNIDVPFARKLFDAGYRVK